MKWRIDDVAIAVALAVAASVIVSGQAPATPKQTQAAKAGRTPWGDPDLQGNWTSEGEYSVPFERPAAFGDRRFLTDEEYAARLKDTRERDTADLQTIDVLSAAVGMPTAPVPHWREQGTSSRRTSLVIDPPDGRFPPRVRPAPPPPTCGGLLTGEPCDSAQDYGLGVRCIVHGSGFPEGMFPTLYNANIRVLQGPGYLAMTYEMIHDTRVIPLNVRAPLSPAIRMWLGDPRGHWDGDTLVVETSNFTEKSSYRGASGNIRLAERFTRTGKDSMQYEITVTDPATWTAPWTAALDLKTRPAGLGLFEYACHEGNYGMFNMLSTARGAEERARRATSAR